MAAVATEHQVTRATISQIIRRGGLTVRKPRTISDAEVNEAVHLYRDGWSLERIGAHLQFDHKTIWRQLKKHGVLMRGSNDWQH